MRPQANKSRSYDKVLPIHGLSLAVVGADFPNRRGPTRRFEIAACRPGDPVELVPEPKNPADPRAVMVLSARGVQMGYLTAERCGWIGRMIADGRELRAIFQESTKYGAVIRVAFDGVDPVLPEAQPRPHSYDDDSGFWPDYIPPDD
ncbi:hypothetical protein CLG96_01975 [Sphingomonas oleivorans]|uniref:HIRAN domain-containing protein n=1 Tax=Sphingomonas oleivorans TaxID=1735121 RepID=A0A2T5G1B2_9SPHN|nr:HIRAN domain-containing protein [Sphingomonas oleivorans]PTQ12933.1 hypothetical protein CLG96_01975 [Sphingomonas oleivorans]